MSDQRIKGQEVEVLLVVDGKIQSQMTDVRSFEVAPKTEIKEEGYLGEKTNRYDEIYNGVRGRMELHFENQSVFDFWFAIIDRAKRRTPGVKVNIKSTLRFPNGQKPRVILQDVFFGEMPMNFAGRGDYGTLGLDFACSDISRI